MAPRPAWKGYLKLSLAASAVEFSGAASEERKPERQAAKSRPATGKNPAARRRKPA